MKNVMGTIKQAGKKKVAVVALTSAVVLGSIGTGAYAYKDEWTAKINKGVDMLAGYIYKEDIQAAINTHNETKKNELRTFISQTINAVTSDLQAHKTAEINRGKAALDSKVAEDKARAKEAVDNAVSRNKQAQESKTNAQINTDKGELDTIVEQELAKVPN
jgi:hypothetical protein